MQQTQKFKVVSVIDTALVDNGSFTVVDVDAGGQGARYVDFLVKFGATDIACTAFKLQESDDDSSYDDVPGASFTGSDLPQDDDDHTTWHIGVNMANGRKRYLRLVLTAGNGSTGVQATAVALLSQLEVAPTTATERGFAGEKLV